MLRKFISILLSALMILSAGALAGTAQTTDPVVYGFSPNYVADVDLSTGEVTAPTAWGAVPNDAQRYYQQQGLAAFCHFGPNTFNDVEWGEHYAEYNSGATQTDANIKRLLNPNEIFTLSEDFDADNMVKTLKDAGFCRLILTCKHHDGFAIWDCTSVYDEYHVEPYTIAQTDYGKNGGDILAELSDACTEYNMDMGIYLSPWDIYLQRKGIFGSTQKTDGTTVDQNSSGQYLTYQNKYNDFYVKQIESIINAKKSDGSYKYGNNNPNRRTDRFVEWWMDGATGSGAALQYYDWERIINTVRKDSPGCQFFGTNKAAEGDNTNDKKFNDIANTGGIHWIGNENGTASSTTWSKLNKGAPGYEVQTGDNGYPRESGAIVGKYNGNTWSVPECDTKMLSSGWFWSQNKQGSLRSMSDLTDIYFRTVGNGATLLLNMSPNTSGKIDDNQKNRVIEFGNALSETFETDLTKADGVTAAATSVYGNNIKYAASNVLDTIPNGEQYDETYWAPTAGQTTGSIEIDFGGSVSFDLVSLEEYLPLGQKISQFSIEYKNVAGVWKPFGNGTTIGAKKLVRNAEVTATALRVNIEDSYDLPAINNIGVYKSAEEFEVEAVEGADLLPADGDYYTPYLHSVANKQGNWQTSDGTHAWTNGNAGSSATYTVTGSNFYVKAIRDPNHGAMTINIDGTDVAVVDTQASQRAENQIVYVSGEYEYGQHTIKLTSTNNSNNKSCIDVYGVYALDNGGKGVVNVEKKEYRTCSASTQKIKVIRQYGSVGEMTVSYATATGSAEQNVGYVYQDGTITFADGETEKEIIVETLYNKDRGNEEALYFFFTVFNSAEDPDAVFGNNIDPKVYIEPIDKDATKEELREFADNVLVASDSYYDSDSYDLFVKRMGEAYSVLEDDNATDVEIGSALKALELASGDLEANENIVGAVIPQSEFTLTAGNSHNGNGPDKAKDGNNSTNWHTAWDQDINNNTLPIPDLVNNEGNDLTLTFNEAKNVSAFAYQPRTDASLNGIITQYEFYYSTSDSDDDWILIDAGSWAADHTLKQIFFTPVNAKRFKLLAKATVGDQDKNNRFVSAAEVNVYGTSAEIDNFVPEKHAVVIKGGDHGKVAFNGEASAQANVDVYTGAHPKNVTFEADEGYAFAGLVDNEGNTYDSLLHVSVDKDITLTAQWKQAPYIVTINGGVTYNGRTEWEMVFEVPVGGTLPEGIELVPWIVGEKAHFIGVVDEDGNEYASIYDVEITGDITLTAVWEYEDFYSLGDVNLDTEINATDATLVLQYFAKIITDETTNVAFDKTLADVNGDSEINATDATLILQYFAKIITVFPVDKAQA